jgi:type II secretory pathway pseudopilin PulG
MGGFRKFLRRIIPRRISGFTLIEVMIAGGLVAFIAVALLPAVFSVMDVSKSSGFMGLCTAAVRTKLQEYVNGIADNSIDVGSNYKPSGFEYTKKRWEDGGYSYCSLTPSTNKPGYQENVYTNRTPFSTPTAISIPETVTGPSGGTTYAVMKGFQLWVMIRHYNPRVLMLNGVVSANGTPSRDCLGSSLTPKWDQLFRLGDAFEVTVTGMVRTDLAVSSGGRKCSPVGKLYDVGHDPAHCPPASDTEYPNPLLTCSATDLIYPPHVPFRYYLGSDGKIRNLQSSITFNSASMPASSLEAAEAHFRSVWVLSGSNITNEYVDSNIRSFAVSPDNRYVYVVRPGELARYGPCYDDGTVVAGTGIGGHVSLSGGSVLDANGIPDCPSKPSITTYAPAAGPDGLKWSIDPNIENIAVDFGTDMTNVANHKVYGLFSSSSQLGSGSSGLVQFTLTSSDDHAGNHISWAESTAFSLNKYLARIRGIYIAQTFPSTVAPNLFFFDNSCFVRNSDTAAAQVASGTYCVSSYNSADTSMQQVSRELPLQVEGVSN